MALADSAAHIERVSVSAYTVPTSEPESDGTLEWDSTALVRVTVDAGERSGLSYTYADKATAHLVQDKLAPLISGHDALAIKARWSGMRSAVRNLGMVDGQGARVGRSPCWPA